MRDRVTRGVLDAHSRVPRLIPENPSTPTRPNVGEGRRQLPGKAHLLFVVQVLYLEPDHFVLQQRCVDEGDLVGGELLKLGIHIVGHARLVPGAKPHSPPHRLR